MVVLGHGTLQTVPLRLAWRMRDKDEVLAAVFTEKAVRRGSPSACDGYYSGYTGTTTPDLNVTRKRYQKEQAAATTMLRVTRLKMTDSNT